MCDPRGRYCGYSDDRSDDCSDGNGGAFENIGRNTDGTRSAPAGDLVVPLSIKYMHVIVVILVTILVTILVVIVIAILVVILIAILVVILMTILVVVLLLAILVVIIREQRRSQKKLS